MDEAIVAGTGPSGWAGPRSAAAVAHGTMATAQRERRGAAERRRHQVPSQSILAEG